MNPRPTEEPLPESFFQAAPYDVAAALLGCALVRRMGGSLVGGLIVETEAYLAEDDPAAHSHRGPTPRNASMFGRAGTLYVYTIHAKYCLNAVTESVGRGSAVLIRALEPVWGLKEMRRRRGRDELRKLCRGPAMLCQSLDVDLRLDGANLCDGQSIWIERFAEPLQFETSATPRIGIRHAAELPLRFFIDGNRYVSGLARDHTRRPTESLLENAFSEERGKAPDQLRR
ncbi:DNA-3-methyladenine glycosylase [Candidatus Laterigemmans baculatus]|uniref:DNA-3-methyladenine glycosylase n=1 Tax=Candidatus Laterigemmans baculatus TaxID=2770505 RepID=UPI001F21D869|nr:DNA-3-methyladenine glycosylase [Candidatus Laterigemmans baculatus]